jgi:chromosome segregation ATPase
VLEASPELLIRNDTSRELKSVNDLIGTQFANVSKEYMKFMLGELREREGHTLDDELDRVYELFSRVREEATEQLKTAQRLRKQDTGLRRRLAKVEKRNRRFRRRTQELESQISAIQSSRVWRFLTILNLLKRAARDRLG